MSAASAAQINGRCRAVARLIAAVLCHCPRPISERAEANWERALGSQIRNLEIIEPDASDYAKTAARYFADTYDGNPGQDGRPVGPALQVLWVQSW